MNREDDDRQDEAPAVGWFSVPNAMAEAEALMRIRSVVAIKAYLVLRRWRKNEHAKHCDPAEVGTAWTSHDHIAEQTGHSKGCVARGIKELIDAGLVVVDTSGRRGRATVYRFPHDDPMGCAGATQPTELGCAGDRKGCAGDSDRLRVRSKELRLSRPIHTNHTYKTTIPINNNSPAAPADAATGSLRLGKEKTPQRKDHPAYRALADVGIGEPTRSQLCDALPMLTSEVVKHFQSKQPPDAGPGLLVESIRADAQDRIAAEALRCSEEVRWNGWVKECEARYAAGNEGFDTDMLLILAHAEKVEAQRKAGQNYVTSASPETNYTCRCVRTAAYLATGRRIEASYVYGNALSVPCKRVAASDAWRMTRQGEIHLDQVEAEVLKASREASPEVREGTATIAENVKRPFPYPVGLHQVGCSASGESKQEAVA